MFSNSISSSVVIPEKLGSLRTHRKQIQESQLARPYDRELRRDVSSLRIRCAVQGGSDKSKMAKQGSSEHSRFRSLIGRDNSIPGADSGSAGDFQGGD
ncbi:hypothetical protein CEXT_747031 [Caerostris extrusa]|uniref:Uncharacterized protein n=1 Tax=Caerostris extrusa TaxID=172846 RepID=A0AAV4P4L1_CAEEX|nr:hypothetical protein CEXT_747031 [Caerostris extrusa]